VYLDNYYVISGARVNYRSDGFNVTNEGAPLNIESVIGSESISSVSESYQMIVVPAATLPSKGVSLKMGAVFGKALIIKE
jgi:hypothetical protein